MKKFFSAVAEYFKKADMVLLVLCCAATAYGIILISSATLSYGTNQNVYIQIGAACIGIFLFVIFSVIDPEILVQKWLLIFLFNILFIGTLFVWGIDGGTGNQGWLRFGSIGIQPAEIVKVTFILLLAKQMDYLRSYKNINSFLSILQLALHFGLMFILIIVSSSDMGSALVYFFIFFIMLYAGGVKLRWFAAGAGAFAATLPVMWIFVLRDDQKNRILAPYVSSIDPTGLGVTWQANQSKIAIASGGLTGQGLYNGTLTQSNSLPAKHTDFIFAVAGEELGMIGCILIVVLLTLIIIRCIYVGIKSNDRFGLTICFGVAGMLMFQMLENIGMCLGLTPVIGLTLPFFSYGGSSILACFAAMGLVSGVKMRPKPGEHKPYRY